MRRTLRLPAPRLTAPRLLAVALLASPLAATPALAQYSGGAAGGGMPTQNGLGGGIPGLGGGGGGASGQQSRRPQPPALPGLAARRAPEPIPADPNANLSPNAALFDAINRGDLAGARDAVTRGADLDARNVLNQTPEDAAVDQGRNEILFYLLSARGGAPRIDPGQGGGPAPDANSVQLSARERQAAARAEAAERRSSAAARAQALTAARSAGTANLPHLWAGDGGAPEPQLGFLGFDAGRPAGAVAPVAASVSDEAPVRRHRARTHARS